jgi:endoglycosylceramidase
MLLSWRFAPARQREVGIASPLAVIAALAALASLVVLPAPVLRVEFQPQRPAANGLPWLSVRGSEIVNSQGQTVILRGFNDDALLQTGHHPLPPPLKPSSAALMEAEGFDVVRIPISWSLLEPTEGHFSQSYLAKIKAMVALCASDHLYVVLDMHTVDFGVAFGGSGAPSWLRVPGVPDWHLPLLSRDWQRAVSPAVNAALVAFWTDPGWQRLYWDAWDFVAASFKDDSNVAGFDLYNEPHPLPLPPAIFGPRLLFPFYARGIADIAKVDPNHLFILEGDLLGDLPTAVRPIHAPDVVYSTHLYSGSIVGPTFTGNPSPLRAELEQGLEEAAQFPAPYWSGELGINRTLPLAATWAEDEIALSDRYLTGWAWWQWDDSADWGVTQNGGPPDLGWLDVLAQPFVREAPGRLDEMSYNQQHRRLAVKISGAARGDLAVVSWPESDGFAQVAGSCARPVGRQDPSSGKVEVELLRGSCSFNISATG